MGSCRVSSRGAAAARARAGRRGGRGLGSRGRPPAKREVSGVILLHMVSHFNKLSDVVHVLRCARASGAAASRRGVELAQRHSGTAPLSRYACQSRFNDQEGVLGGAPLAGRDIRLEPSPSATHREDYSSARGESSGAPRGVSGPQWCMGVGLAGEGRSVPG